MDHRVRQAQKGVLIVNQSSGSDGGKKQASVTKVVCLLYGAFFGVWCLGAAIGEIWTGPDQPALWGMPVWFLVGCVFSFVGVSAVLVHFVRRWLQ